MGVNKTPNTTNSKRKQSDTQPLSGSKTEKKISAKETPPKSAFKADIPLPRPEMPPTEHEELVKLIRDQTAMLTDLSAKADNTNSELARIDTENKAMIQHNMSTIRSLGEAFTLKASKDDDRFEALEEKVSHITDLMQNGSSLTMDPASKLEAAHEKNLRELIIESNSCVTVLGHGEDDLSTQKLAHLITTHGYQLNTTKPGQKLMGLQKLGASAAKAPYKLTLDSPITASALIEQSKAKSRASEGNLDHVRFVRHFPQAYAQASRDFRQMASIMYDKGVHASVEYEGTTLTLKGKSMMPGGEWVIIPGGEFKPLVVGRQTAPENEDPALTRARTLLGSALDNAKDSDLAKTLNLHTEKDLGSKKLMQAFLGPTISDGLIDVSSAPERKGSSAAYLLKYSSREHAKKALEASKKADTITELNKDKSFMTLHLPVVAP